MNAETFAGNPEATKHPGRYMKRLAARLQTSEDTLERVIDLWLDFVKERKLDGTLWPQSVRRPLLASREAA